MWYWVFAQRSLHFRAENFSVYNPENTLAFCFLKDLGSSKTLLKKYFLTFQGTRVCINWLDVLMFLDLEWDYMCEIHLSYVFRLCAALEFFSSVSYLERGTDKRKWVLNYSFLFISQFRVKDSYLKWDVFKWKLWATISNQDDNINTMWIYKVEKCSQVLTEPLVNKWTY